ncbi:hypothetical protein HJG60_009874 [Phyllostomus discolor]|uniref:Uncharacterized protein n=1 Tax=Phyllostomus discolor TaxID=89673 RepID=A0A834ET53_9CHIR|nr:hypothetical protein HJG60_009874 [Phyllostomus discolor]
MHAGFSSRPHEHCQATVTQTSGRGGLTAFSIQSGFSTTEIYFSWFWRLGGPRSTFQQSLSGEGLLRGSRTAMFLLLCHMTGGQGSSSSLFYKGTNPIHEGPTLITKSLPKGPTSKIPPHWGLGVNICILRQQKNSVYGTVLCAHCETLLSNKKK